MGGGGGGGECYTEHLFTFKTVLKIKYINSYVLQCLEQDLCRKCAKNIDKNPPKHECVHVVKKNLKPNLCTASMAQW